MIERSKYSIFEHIVNFISGSNRDLWHKPTPISPNYQAYTTQFDTVCNGKDLASVLGKPSRDAEDTFLAAQAMFKFGISLLRDSNRLKLAKAMKSFRALLADRETVLTFLVDHSGSMRGEHIRIALAICAIWGKVFTDAGARVEVLGFTTSSWEGGQSRELWLQNGKSPSPGRLCDLLHIIHRPAGDEGEWSDEELVTMLTPNLFKENIDGEAIIWAEQRLLQHLEKRRILVIVSDGAPVDDSTLLSNSDSFLENHIIQEIRRIESESALSIGAIGIRHSVERYYSQSVAATEAIVSTDIEDLFKKLLSSTR